MKIVTLCGDCSCCPVVKVADELVEISEEGNLCVLQLDEWETLKRILLVLISPNPQLNSARTGALLPPIF